jgi:hypothetical protein
MPVRVLERQCSPVRRLPQAKPVLSTSAPQATADLGHMLGGGCSCFVRQMVSTDRARRGSDVDDSPDAPAGRAAASSSAGDAPSKHGAAGAPCAGAHGVDVGHG